ncbi:hypothetical protein H8D36_07660 [archaeon]|nr:hypothetical protein [archaeon]MBL7057030.1 hypothetical protein [Candidatus Woesearchaeota archaeon]
MPETLTLIDGKKLSYEGLFEPKEIYTVIDQFFKKHGFDKHEFKNAEQIFEHGKQLEMDLRPYKKLSDYVKVEIKIEIVARNLKEVEIEKKGIKKKMMSGPIDISFTSYFITDYEGTWEMKPFYYVFRMLVDKYVYKSYMNTAKNELMEVTNEIYDELRSYLNMHKYY